MEFSGKKILITGASGSLGRQLVYDLTSNNIVPICQVRKTSDSSYIDSLKLEKRIADLQNNEELEKLVQGVDYIIHTAAKVDFRQNKLTEFTAINTIGALNLFKAAQKAGVEKFVHISTVAAVGGLPFREKANIDAPEQDYPTADEQTKFNLTNLRIPYIMTKHAAEVELNKIADNGKTELIMVNPSIIVAPSRSGNDREAAIKRFFKSFLIPNLDNVINLVDLRDVSSGVIKALKKGKHNQRYILAGENLTGRELALKASGILGKVPHLIKLPKSFLKFASRGALIGSQLRGKPKIMFYPDLVKLLDYDWSFSSDKARQELDYKYRSVQITLKEILTNCFFGTSFKP